MVAPYHIYTLALTEGVHTRFLTMKPTTPVFYDGQEFQFFVEKKNSRDEDQSLFVKFHFSNFILPLPFNNPLFYLIPDIKTDVSGVRLGAHFIDGKNVELFSFMVEKNYKLETITGEQKLFVLPIFKNYINRKLDTEVWKDLFSKKLSIPSNLGKSFFESLLTLKEVTYNELVYNIYILFNRGQLFPANATRISYNSKTSQGLIEIKSDDPRIRIERLFLIENGIIYSMTIKTRIGNIASEKFRSRFFRETSYKASTVDSAITIYADYKRISYNGRVDQQGMTYLFSAWSHDLSNREYIRVIILFLERGTLNLKYLRPFYEYAYKKFGSNFSGANDVLEETADQKLKRKVKLELESEVKKEEMENKQKFEGHFSSPEEKINYFLQKAKENKNNSDDSEKLLLQE
jgi:hypothetical protein